MDCEASIVKLIERARVGLDPGPDLDAHLKQCERCRNRWDDEQDLTTQFRTIRLTAAAQWTADGRRESLLREFDARHRRSWLNRALSAAAVLALAVGLGWLWRGSMPGDGRSALPANAQQKPPITLPGDWDASHVDLVESAYLEATPDDADFIAVPFAPPLAAGEMVRVVRTELRPMALARMGFDVDAEAGEIPADVIIGEDGFPRAVRLVNAEF